MGHSPASCRVHDSLASLLAECRLKILAIVRRKVVTGDRLTAVLVDSLEDLVTGGISQTREERNELLSDSSGGRVPEDDLVQLAGKHSAVVRVAPALVGAPNPRLVWTTSVFTRRENR